MRPPKTTTPAVNPRLGRCQLSVSFSQAEAAEIELFRAVNGFRSWNEAIRLLVSIGLKGGRRA